MLLCGGCNTRGSNRWIGGSVSKLLCDIMDGYGGGGRSPLEGMEKNIVRDLQEGLSTKHFGTILATPLANAAMRGDEQAYTRLISGDAIISANFRTWETQWTMLGAAVFGRNVDIVTALLREASGECLRQLNVGFGPKKSNTTPLYIATKQGSPEMVSLLLDAGATPMIVDKDGVGPLHLAAKAGNAAIIGRILAASPTQLTTCC